jgi:hypothetical protein
LDLNYKSNQTEISANPDQSEEMQNPQDLKDSYQSGGQKMRSIKKEK